VPRTKKPRSTKSKPRTPLTKELILRTALVQIDQEGIHALSMRSLGTKLNVEAMSLYNHVKNKDDILSGVLDLIVEEITVPGEDSNWRTAIEKFALSARAVLKQHPWATGLMDSIPVSGPARLHYYDSVIGTFCQAGFSLEQASRGFSLIDSYIYGFALQQSFVESGHANSGEEYNEKETITKFQKNIPESSYPYLMKMTKWAMENGYDPEEDFRFGINLILSGFERLLS
jgi:AcrR family transcriptional regulator